MNDLELTENHDLLLVDGDFNLLGREAKVAKQTLKINLLLYKGDWFLDNTIGIPYFEEIFGKITNTSLADNIIEEAAKVSYGIDRITNFSSSLSLNRQYSVDRLEAITTDGEIVSISSLQV